MKLKIFIFFFLSSLPLFNSKLVMIIRHGEKIKDGSTNLSFIGEARAKCLLNVFGTNGTFVSPQKIFAQNPTIKKKSTRPRDTVIPLADTLNISVDLSYSSKKTEKLTNDIINSPEEVILVSWSKERIPEIANLLGIYNPPIWKKAYDEIWIISDGKTPFLRNPNDTVIEVPQKIPKNKNKNKKNIKANIIFQNNNVNNLLTYTNNNIYDYDTNNNDMTAEMYPGKNVTLRIFKQSLEGCMKKLLQNKDLKDEKKYKITNSATLISKNNYFIIIISLLFYLFLLIF